MSYSHRLRSEQWFVADAPIAQAREIVERCHYARGASNTATYLHGLYRRADGSLWGVAWWIPPTRSAAQATYPSDWRGVLCLSRLVIEPGAPKNACTFLLARSRALIPADRWPALVTYADDWQGHDGGIYRADNWQYVGKTKPERTYQIDGRMVARKAGGKTRTHAEMIALGAQMIGVFSKHKYVMIRSTP